MKLKESELAIINGGAKITAAMISAITTAATFVFKLGQSLGSYVRSRISGKYC